MKRWLKRFFNIEATTARGGLASFGHQYWLTLLAFGPVWLALAVCFYWEFVDAAPPITNTAHYEVTLQDGTVVRDPRSVRIPLSDPVLLISRHACVTRDTQVVTQRLLVGPVTYSLAPVERYAAKGCHRGPPIVVELDPDRDLPAGTYNYSTELHFYVNPLHPNVTFSMPSFQIVLYGDPARN